MTERRSPRLLAWAVYSLLLGTTACSRSDPDVPDVPNVPDVQEPRPKQLPLRLFEAELLEPEAILESVFRGPADLEQWWVLGRGEDAGSLQPAAEGLPPIRDGRLTLLPEGRPLFRLLEVPPGVPLRIELELAEELSGSPGDPSTCVQCLSLGDLEWTGAMADVLSSRSLGMPSGGSTPLGGLLAYRLRDLRESHLARIEAPTRISLKMEAPREPELRVVVLRPDGELRSARSLRVLLDHPQADKRRLRRPHEEVLFGEQRIAVRIAAGGTHEVTATVPSGVGSLFFGVTVDPQESPAATPLPFSVKAERDGEEILAHRGFVKEHDATREAFQDVQLPWPADRSSAESTIRLSFTNDGERELVLSQPILRAAAAMKQWNLLLISLDTLRADHLSGSGYHRPTSPFLDGFRQHAVNFEQFLSVASHTLPAHVSMLTGLLPIQHQVQDKTHSLDARKVVYLPALLAENGYLTAAFTGGGFLLSAFGFSHGFDRFVMVDPITPAEGLGLPPKRAQPGRRSLDDVARWIEERRDESWFAFVHTYAIHNYYAPPEIVRQFDTDPETSWRGNLPSRLSPLYWRADGQAPRAGDVQHLADLYDATIRYVDLELERLFERLEGQGLLRNTLVVITSDHGEEFFEHGGLQHSLTLFEEQLRIPLMIRLPDRANGMEIEDPVILADLAPTLVDLLGLRESLPDPSIWRNSRASLVDGNSASSSSAPLLAQIERADARATALRLGGLKLIWSDTSDKVLFPARREWSLFDLSIDPTESNDLALSDPTLLKKTRLRFERTLEEWRQGALEISARPLDDDVLKELRALGY